MAKKLKDTDYLFISTYLHSRERDLLTGARMERMIDAPTAADAAKVLTEIGYGEFDAASPRELGSVLAQEQEKLFEDLYRFVPDKAVVDVFKVKYDYHNLKALIKARATGTDASDRLLLDAGRVSAEDMRRAVWEGDYSLLPPTLRAAAVEAVETLSATGDPQLADFQLDRAYYGEMLSAAEEMKNVAVQEEEGAHVALGTIVGEIKEVSRSYKEARMALDVGKIFFDEKDVIAYSSLGIGRLIYQLPIPLCKMFIREIFDGRSPDDFDEETLTTINKFFENSLNVSETSRQLYIHRNTLVYRLDKLQKSTGLDLRVFEDAITFKIALMVVKYMNYMESLNN